MKQLLFFLFIMMASVASYAQPKALEYVDVENFKMQQVDNNKAAVSMDIRLYNPNHYKLELKDADINVFINGNKLGRVQVDDKVEVPREDTCVLPVILNVDIQQLLPNAVQLLLSNGMADILLKGTVKAGRHGIYVPIPINYEMKQDIGSMLKLN